MLLVEAYRDTADVGIYAQGVSIIELVLRVPTALGAVIFSHSAAAEDAERFRQRMRSIVIRAVPLLVLAAVGVCAVAPWVIPTLFGEEFRASVPVVWALAPGMVSIGVFQLIVSDFNGQGRPEVGLYAASASLVVNVVLNVWWIPVYGVIGAGVASTVSYTVAAAILFIAQGRIARPES
jgi:O-antigen/teichoic acid export membrane protein